MNSANEENMENMKDDIENIESDTNVVHWTSGDVNIDKLIQNSQLNANSKYQLIEWIEYSDFENIEFIAYGGFGSVYKAIWKNRAIKKSLWQTQKGEWDDDNGKEVAIKKLQNATNVSLELLNEINNNLKLNYEFCNKIYGVTRDPQDKGYAIVTEFQNDGNLRDLIKKNHHILNWRLIFRILYNISDGLSAIHRKNYLHKDFHSGNILNKIFSSEIVRSVVSDFGLCCPAGQSSEDKKLHGVLPFMAPEVLRGGEFTKAADVYGFGMLMLEIISGKVPFADRDYDLVLALDICKGERPPIPEYTPKPYADLMKRCWDPIPSNRPTARELQNQINVWNNIFSNNSLNDRQEFSQEQENRWKVRLAELATNSHSLKKSQNFLASKKLDYSKQLTQLIETGEVEMIANGNNSNTLYSKQLTQLLETDEVEMIANGDNSTL
ncbi:hypothetical protein RclHR1_01360020 [Rhizophagus clarus]|uniref:Kinase-like domain-containing protein n=1 Tax=Rhizophagus clarus TaxID=94130 RepID=A0A2Z6QMV9_9GLOM|nr:hypothetical protein RclHR1_01360020 [Rhizophagus clarus]GES92898.1 kinase-like domain-containing protein [Rhizophagus clarus]